MQSKTIANGTLKSINIIDIDYLAHSNQLDAKIKIVTARIIEENTPHQTN